MERINRWGVMPIEGEIMEIEDVFPGIQFGDAARVRQFVGHRSRPTENVTAFCIHFKTGSNTEVDVGFYNVAPSIIGMSGDKELIISDHAYAKQGDEGNVDGNITFVSGNGKDPRGQTTKMGFNANGTGLAQVTIPPRPDGGLKPDTDYYVTVRRTGKTAAGDQNPPMGIIYTGTDDPDAGGEQLIKIQQADIPDGGVFGVPMSFNGVAGVFIAND